jgi:hypothetical protein
MSLASRKFTLRLDGERKKDEFGQDIEGDALAVVRRKAFVDAVAEMLCSSLQVVVRQIVPVRRPFDLDLPHRDLHVTTVRRRRQRATLRARTMAERRTRERRRTVGP